MYVYLIISLALYTVYVCQCCNNTELIKKIVNFTMFTGIVTHMQIHTYGECAKIVFHKMVTTAMM